MRQVADGFVVRSADELEELVHEWGFLPFFRSRVPGFSVEEHTPRELWFSDEEDGPWEWKGLIAARRGCIYGKLFEKKAGFVSREWLPDLLNYRRDGYDLDARYDEGLAPHKDLLLWEALRERGALLTPEWKRLTGYVKGGNTGFDTAVTRLQMQTYVTVERFDYMTDKHGRAYGWGVARFTTPEALFGEDAVAQAYARPPAQSRERISAHLRRLLPHADDAQIGRLIG